jgi:Protein of unknown function (DUF3168)
VERAVIEAAIIAILSNDAGVAGAIAGGIWAVLMPEEVQYPALSYTLVDSPSIQTLNEPTGLVHPRVQVSAWANSYAEAKRAADAVRKALDFFAGPVSTPDGPVLIRSIRWEDERENYERNTRTFHCSNDFFVMYQLN